MSLGFINTWRHFYPQSPGASVMDDGTKFTCNILKHIGRPEVLFLSLSLRLSPIPSFNFSLCLYLPVPFPHHQSSILYMFFFHRSYPPDRMKEEPPFCRTLTITVCARWCALLSMSLSFPFLWSQCHPLTFHCCFTLISARRLASLVDQTHACPDKNGRNPVCWIKYTWKVWEN